jgi:hypothetical protein
MGEPVVWLTTDPHPGTTDDSVTCIRLQVTIPVDRRLVPVVKFRPMIDGVMSPPNWPEVMAEREPVHWRRTQGWFFYRGLIGLDRITEGETVRARPWFWVAS